MPSTERSAAKAATKAKVLAAARTVFNTLGYERATIRDIARTAGMSTGAVFANWTGKAALYRDIFGHEPVSPELGRQLLMGARQVASAASLTQAQEAVTPLLAQAEGR